MRKEDPVNRISRFLSKVLRHSPESIGLTLDRHGWAAVDDILKVVPWMDRPNLLRAVNENDKQRFALSDDGQKIRARQGHSVKVELELEPVEPPRRLYHGTYQKAVQSIFRTGIQKMQRHHVHMSEDKGTATAVGRRSGAPILFEINAEQMFKDGHVFYCSENGVWLTDHVPVRYLTLA